MNKVNESIWTGRIDDTETVQVSVIIKSLNWLISSKFRADAPSSGLNARKASGGIKVDLGAAEAPNALRSGLANLPWRFPDTARLFDVGNIACVGEDLESAQQQLR